MKIKQLVASTFLAAAVTVGLGGCLGGGTIGTGISSMGTGGSRAHSAIVFSIKGRVVDAKGKPQPGAVVTGSTSVESSTRQADASGMVNLPVKMYSGEEISFAVKAGGRQYQGTQQVSPAGEDVIERSIVIGGAAGVSVEE